jgi:hypothetical protein
MRVFSLSVEWVTAPTEKDIDKVVGAAGKLDPGTPDVGQPDQQYAQLLQSELAKIGLGGLTRIGPVETITPETLKLVSQGGSKIVQDERVLDIDVGFEPDTAKLRPGMDTKVAAAFAQEASKPDSGVSRADIEASCALYKAGPTADKNHFEKLANERAEVLKGLLKNAFGSKLGDEKINIGIAAGNPNFPGTSGPAPDDIRALCKGAKGGGAAAELPKGFSCSPTPHWEKDAENKYFSQFRFSRARLHTWHAEQVPPRYEAQPGQVRALVVAIGNIHYYNNRK